MFLHIGRSLFYVQTHTHTHTILWHFPGVRGPLRFCFWTSASCQDRRKLIISCLTLFQLIHSSDIPSVYLYYCISLCSKPPQICPFLVTKLAGSSPSVLCALHFSFPSIHLTMFISFLYIPSSFHFDILILRQLRKF